MDLPSVDIVVQEVRLMMRRLEMGFIVRLACLTAFFGLAFGNPIENLDVPCSPKEITELKVSFGVVWEASMIFRGFKFILR